MANFNHPKIVTYKSQTGTPSVYAPTLQDSPLVPAGPVPVERLIDHYATTREGSPSSPPAPCRWNE